MDPSSGKTTTAAASEPVVDPVESLRAAALSTLKAKRRKPATIVTSEKLQPPPALSRPPPSTDIVQLDYGLEEDKGTPVAMAVDAPATDLAKEVHRDQQSRSREEGELSEEEVRPARQSMTLSPVPGRKASGTPSLGAGSVAEMQKLDIEEASAPLDSTRSSQEAPPPMTPPQHQSAPMEGILETPDHLALAREEAEIADSLMMDDSDYPPTVTAPVFVLDADHVRPGLRITQEEYDTIKQLILDLLGWGVTVETMLESGVNKEVIFYVFSELDLRLPDDFDTSGILPYTPEALNQPQLWSQSSEMSSASRGVPTRVNGHNSALDHNAKVDLHDRERQRRQELLARKAARAALQQARPVIKTETIDSPITLNAVDEQRDVVMNSATVPVPTVDDFLNSLGSVQQLQASASSSSREASVPLSAMDVEPAENGQVLEYTPPSPSFTEYTPPAVPDSAGTTGTFEPPPSSSGPPPSSVDSASTTFSRISDMSKEDLISPPTAQIIPPKMVRAAIRRPANRPVASDFVDINGDSSRLPTPAANFNNRNGRAGTASITRPLRKTTSFSTVGNARRCVIDLSDSEDEGAVGHDQPRMPMPSLADQRRDSSWQVRTGKFASPALSKPATPSISPAILEQKELEIKKMREMIAQREEETRLKKLALAKAAATSDAKARSATPTQTTPPVEPKQEEPEVTSIPPVAEVETDVVMELDNTVDVPASPSSVASTPPAARAELPPENPPVVVNKEPSVPPTNEGPQESNYASQPADVPRQDTPGTPQVGPSLNKDVQKSAAAHLSPSVDADVSMSSSTQVNGNSTSPSSPAPQQILPKPDERSLLFSSSTLKNEADAQSDKFSSYHSLSESYPGLFHRPQQDFSFSRDSSSFISSSEPSGLPFYSDLHPADTGALPSASTVTRPSVPLPDLKPLKMLAAAKLFKRASRICQYEIPGGGVCRDSKCTDIHLSRFEGVNGQVEVTPSDRDTAQYLFDALPRGWLQASGITSAKVILRALQQIDQDTPGQTLSFDDRVARALLSFNPRPMTMT